MASGLKGARVVGNPVRRNLSELDRAGLRAQAREFFGLDPDAPTLLVFGGSQGAARINAALAAAAPDLAAAGIGVLHAYGRKNELERAGAAARRCPPYVAVPYLDRMDLAYSAADLVLARSGAMTVAEIAAVGLPAVYVPLPHGNGEQRLNASAQVASGAAIIIDDADLDRGSRGRHGDPAGDRRHHAGRDDGVRRIDRRPTRRRIVAQHGPGRHRRSRAIGLMVTV